MTIQVDGPPEAARRKAGSDDGVRRRDDDSVGVMNGLSLGAVGQHAPEAKDTAG